ncbi:hypothetical protein BM527_01130 [Alteromonas sp. Mex14]|nr:hypothetical protein BM527_01130 [Alteromonas sp. Mex14]
MDFSVAFFSSDGSRETLATRNTLLKEQTDGARREKDQLLQFLKSELHCQLGIKVGYWIQGSFKNHTVIRPVRVKEEFDIDVGIYLFADAESIGLDAKTAKSALRKVLASYCQRHEEAILEEPKSNCERVRFPERFHIDLPLYYVNETSEKYRLATESNGWIDSDPKSLQSWFDDRAGHLSDAEKARLRRVIKALKTWVCLKKVKLPSIAISCFVACNYKTYSSEEDALWSLADSITSHLIDGGVVLSPRNGDDLIGATETELKELKRECARFQQVLKALALSNSVVMSHQLWSIEFEHTLPPIDFVVEQPGNSNLPALTCPPVISVKVSNGTPEQVTTSVNAYRGDYVDFKVRNIGDYPESSQVIWMVRNTHTDASMKNDLGHKRELPISEIANEHCEYRGKHYMECTVINSGQILGVTSVTVNIRTLERPARNPVKKRYGPRR